MENAARSDSPRNPVFSPAGGVFKLIPPPSPGSSKFKPNERTEVALVAPQQPGPTEFGHLGIPTKPAASNPTPAAPPAPPSRPTVVATAAPSPEDDDAKIMARMEKLIKNEQRMKDVEEENRALTRTIARLQAENDALRTK